MTMDEEELQRRLEKLERSEVRLWEFAFRASKLIARLSGVDEQEIAAEEENARRQLREQGLDLRR
jgi:hypothetical protein